jgi:PKD domain
VNDSMGNAIQLAPNYATIATPLPILPSPQAPLGGWNDATSTDDAALALPSCFGSAGFHSMWYRLDVPESGVLTIGLSSDNVKDYEPIVTIIDTAKNNAEVACSLGGTALIPGQAVVASGYVANGTTYLIRIASAVDNPNDPNGLPGLQLTETIHDITPPTIRVTVSKTVGVGKAFTFSAHGSTDNGSGIDQASAQWVFYNGGGTLEPVSGPLELKHAWGLAGLHRVTLQLSDLAGNKNTYQFNVLVHSFVPPKVSIRVLAPRRGARTLSIQLTHDMPVRVRLVVLQAGRKLRTIPSQTVEGSRTTTIPIALTGKIAKTGFVIVSGTASDLSNPPNTVALATCSVRPGKAGGVCA